MSADAQWRAILVGLLSLIALTVILIALTDSSQQGSEDPQQASSTETEETTEGETTEEVAERTSEKRRKPPRPEPRTPEERVRANVESMPAFEKLEPDDPQEVWVDFYNDNGCRDVLVRFRDPGVTFGLGTQADWIEAQMWQIYKAIHADKATHEAVCDVSVEAYGDSTDDYGQVTEEKLYETLLTRDVAAKVNWSNADSVNYAELWQAEAHPRLESERDRDNAAQALDCLQEGGLGDFDWLECP